MKLHLIHDWSEWSDPIDTHCDHTKVQRRYCLICNKVEVKKIRQPWNKWFSAERIKGKAK